MRELTLPGRMVLIPGYACDGRVFGPQRRAFGDRLETPDWIAPKPNESIRHYAQRWAETLCRPGDDRPMVLGGLSFGGLVAQELAACIEPAPRCVLLIASTRIPERWTLPVQMAQLLGRLVPGASVNKAASLLSLPFALRDGVDDAGKKLLRAMARDADPAMLKWAAAAAIDWPGAEPAGPDAPPVYSIHGRDDWVIPDDGSADTTLDLGRHLINLSHAESVNRFLFDHMLQHVPEAQQVFPAIENPRLTAQRRLLLEGAPAGTPLV